jgi:hypothetical protein
MPLAVSFAIGTRRKRASSRFDPRASEAALQARASVVLLRGSFAALRCRAFIQQRAWPEAIAEVLLLEASLCEVDGLSLDAEATREVEQLRTRKERLRAVISGSQACSVEC